MINIDGIMKEGSDLSENKNISLPLLNIQKKEINNLSDDQGGSDIETQEFGSVYNEAFRPKMLKFKIKYSVKIHKKNKSEKVEKDINENRESKEKEAKAKKV
jgi:hypothetical protein